MEEVKSFKHSTKIIDMSIGWRCSFCKERLLLLKLKQPWYSDNSGKALIFMGSYCLLSNESSIIIRTKLILTLEKSYQTKTRTIYNESRAAQGMVVQYIDLPSQLATDKFIHKSVQLLWFSEEKTSAPSHSLIINVIKSNGFIFKTLLILAETNKQGYCLDTKGKGKLIQNSFSSQYPTTKKRGAWGCLNPPPPHCILTPWRKISQIKRLCGSISKIVQSQSCILRWFLILSHQGTIPEVSINDISNISKHSPILKGIHDHLVRLECSNILTTSKSPRSSLTSYCFSGSWLVIPCQFKHRLHAFSLPQLFSVYCMHPWQKQFPRLPYPLM